MPRQQKHTSTHEYDLSAESCRVGHFLYLMLPSFIHILPSVDGEAIIIVIVYADYVPDLEWWRWTNRLICKPHQ